MGTLVVQVDDKILKEAEDALNSIGMDTQIAVNVFLRRVAIEKGLPMSMTVSTNQKEPADSSENQAPLSNNYSSPTRNNNSITRTMVDEVWKAFIKYHRGISEISSLSDEVSEKSGMNRGSAFIYLTILSNLVKGEYNTRNLKMKDLEYLMVKIKTELGNSEYQNAIQSLKQSIPYWREKIPGTFADNVEAFVSNEFSR
jgi:addiction module RelB/DinJ family antitoxin